MIPSAIQAIKVEPVSFRLKSPFITAAGKKSLTHNVRILVELANGLHGYGEGSSSLAMPEASPKNMISLLRELMPELRGQDIRDYRALIQSCWRMQAYHPTAVAALECALLDAYARLISKPLYQFLGGRQEAVETDFTLSVNTPNKQAAEAKKAAKKGFRRFKVKLAGDSPVQDAERLLAVHRAVPKARLVADANQSMNATEALHLARLLERWQVPLVFLEQPFPRHKWDSMRLFRRQCRLPLFADESVRSSEDALRAFESQAVDGVNIKVAKSGILGALDIIELAKRFKKRLAIGCMEESKLGLAASVHLACGTGAFEWVDLDSVFLLEDQPVRGGFRMKGPKLSVEGVGPGIGIR